MPPRLPIGIDDFRELRELGLEYVDKSHLLVDLLDLPGTKVFLFPRPRRFGKTLNLSMLRCFLERRERNDEDLSPLFKDLRVWQAGDAIRDHFQRYPVLHLTFKDIKPRSFEECWTALRLRVVALFDQHRYLLDSGRLSEVDAAQFQRILDGSAPRPAYEAALGELSRHLHRHHGERAVILIDEYDAPIHAGTLNGYAPDILAFLRGFFTAGLKDNPHLFKAVLTGILRIARESIFSGLNNLAVYGLLRPEFATAFGFTEPEVEDLLARVGHPEDLDIVRAWYNGYLFGGQVIYNPWSVLNFLQQEEKEPQPFWVSTSSNDLVKDLLQRHALRIEADVEALLAGDSIERVLDENIALEQLQENPDTLWNLLVFAGYLKAEKRPRGRMEQPAHRLSIPNREVRQVYTSTFREWMQARLGAPGGDLGRLTRALLQGDAEALEQQLQAFATSLLSYHDTAGLSAEQVYHAFVVGLLAVMEPDHVVRSNRESGAGRPDVLILPNRPGMPGVVLELKVVKGGKRPSGKVIAKALENALEQIRRNDYAAELRAAGAAPIHAFAVAFDGKQVRVKRDG